MHNPTVAADPRDDHIDREAQAALLADLPPAVAPREVVVHPIDTIVGHRKTAAQIAAEAAARAATEDVPQAPMRRGYSE
jgi:hypothetical protein